MRHFSSLPFYEPAILVLSSVWVCEMWDVLTGTCFVADSQCCEGGPGQCDATQHTPVVTAWSNGNNTTVLWGITACPARVPRLESRQQAGTGLSGSDLQLPQVRQSPAGPGTGTVGAGNILCKKTKYFHCNSDSSNPPLSPGPDCLPCPPVSLCRSEDGEWCAPPPQGLAWLRR